MRSFSISVVILLCFAIFESAILSNFSILPAVPDFLLLCTLYFSLHNGRLYGSANGFVAGLFLDFLTAAPLGLYCLIRTVIGYSFGFFNKIFNINGIFFPIALGSIATLLKVILLWGVSIFFPITVNTYSLFSTEFLFELVSNAILTPVIFRFLDIFKNTLNSNGE